MERLVCQNCGSPLHQEGDHYTCRYCGSMYRDDQAEKIAAMLEETLDDLKLENLAKARRAQYDAVHVKYPSKAAVVAAATAVLVIRPEDYLARMYLGSYDSNPHGLVRLLANSHVTESEAKETFNWLIEGLNPRLIGPLRDFAERHFRNQALDDALKRLEEEAAKAEEGIYDASLPRDVFLCYSSGDMPRVIETMEFLEENDFSCWAAFRNLRAGRGAAERYNEEIQKAMKACRCIVFLSSSSSRTPRCDAVSIELPFLLTDLPNKPRAEFLLEDYPAPDDEDHRVPIRAMRILKEAFDGLQRVRGEEELVDRVVYMLSEGQRREKEKAKRIAEEAAEKARKELLAEMEAKEAARKELEAAAEEKRLKEAEEKRRKEEKELTEKARKAAIAEFEAKEAARKELEEKRLEEERKAREEKESKEAAERERLNQKARELEEQRLALEKERLEMEKRRAASPTPSSTTSGGAPLEGDALLAAFEKAQAEKKRREAEEAKRRAEEKARLEAEQKAKEEEAKRLAEEKAKQEAEVLQAAMEKAEKEAEKKAIDTPVFGPDGKTVWYGIYPQDLEKSEEIKKALASYKKKPLQQVEYKGKYYLWYGYDRLFRCSPIRWIILKEKDGECLLLSERILDRHCFSSSGKTLYYRSSELRGWLINDFVARAFPKGRKYIVGKSQVFPYENEDPAFVYGSEKFGFDTMKNRCMNFGLVHAKLTDFSERSRYVYWGDDETLLKDGRGRTISTDYFTSSEKQDNPDVGVRPGIKISRKPIKEKPAEKAKSAPTAPKEPPKPATPPSLDRETATWNVGVYGGEEFNFWDVQAKDKDWVRNLHLSAKIKTLLFEKDGKDVRGEYGTIRKLKSIDVDPANPYWCNIDGCLVRKSDMRMIWAKPAEDGFFKLPKGVRSIDDRAFVSGNPNVVDFENGGSFTAYPTPLGIPGAYHLSVFIPAAITTIGKDVLYDFDSITYYFEQKKPLFGYPSGYDGNMFRKWNTKSTKKWGVSHSEFLAEVKK